jgi:membrane protease YdiL (CAAX protease family)
VILAALYQRTGSLLPPIVAHGINNVIAVVSIWRGWEI